MCSTQNNIILTEGETLHLVEKTWIVWFTRTNAYNVAYRLGCLGLPQVFSAHFDPLVRVISHRQRTQLQRTKIDPQMTKFFLFICRCFWHLFLLYIIFWGLGLIIETQNQGSWTFDLMVRIHERKGEKGYGADDICILNLFVWNVHLDRIRRIQDRRWRAEDMRRSMPARMNAELVRPGQKIFGFMIPDHECLWNSK